MTDNDIIKALELVPHCNVYIGECKKCPYRWVDDCATKFPKDALDLINRQKAEIERLSTSLGEWEISALKKADRVDELEREKSHLIYSSMIGTTRAEAITEFEEKVVSCGVRSVEIGHFDNNSYEFITIRKDKFDQIAKEMKEGVNNDGV